MDMSKLVDCIESEVLESKDFEGYIPSALSDRKEQIANE